VRALFRPHYVTWSEQRRIESHGPAHLRNIVQIITETGLRVYKELTPMCSPACEGTKSAACELGVCAGSRKMIAPIGVRL
jgi:hypothetical protein